MTAICNDEVGSFIAFLLDGFYAKVSYKDQKNGGELYKLLHRVPKSYRKRFYGKNDYRGRIPGRVDIDERPSIVDDRARVGDFEADTVIGGKHKGAIVTLAERRTRLFFAFPIFKKTAELTNDAIIRLLTPIKQYVHTITFDNGREFSMHQAIAEALDCDNYFAKPYHSWQRGLNEQSNGLLRRYFPKKMDLRNVTEKEVWEATEKLNHRPRKCLGYKTPWEAFFELTKKQNKKE